MLKRILLVLVLLYPVSIYAQAGGSSSGSVVIHGVGAPTGSCPLGVIYLDDNTHNAYNCVANVWGAIGPTGGAVFNVKATAYGAKGTGRVVTDISSTITSPIITSGGLANFTAADVGKLAWVVSGGSTLMCGSQTKSVVTTVLSVQSTTQATLSTNCGATGGPSESLYIGPDDSSAISLACTTALGGGTVYAPAGGYMLGSGVAPNPTCDLHTGQLGAIGLVGDGQDATTFYVAPWYDHTFNFGSVFAMSGGTFYQYASGWTLDGTGVSKDDGVADTLIDFGKPLVDHITIKGFVFTRGDNECLYVSGSGTPSAVGISNSFVHCRQVTFLANTAFNWMFLNNDFQSGLEALTVSSNAGNSTINIEGGTYMTSGTANGSPVGAIAIPQSGSPGNITVNIHGAMICAGENTTPAIVFNIASLVANLDSVKINEPSAGPCIATATAATGIKNTAGTVNIEKSYIGSTGTGVGINNSGTVVAGIGNTFNGAALAGTIPMGPNTLSGGCTGVAAAAAPTLSLIGLGANVTSACTDVTAFQGPVMNNAGTMLGLSVSSSAAGKAAGSGVFTVNKNGTGTTITCTVGVGTTCTDYAHTVSVVQGDIITVTFTTQALETLADLKVAVYVAK